MGALPARLARSRADGGMVLSRRQRIPRSVLFVDYPTGAADALQSAIPAAYAVERARPMARNLAGTCARRVHLSRLALRLHVDHAFARSAARESGALGCPAAPSPS